MEKDEILRFSDEINIRQEDGSTFCVSNKIHRDQDYVCSFRELHLEQRRKRVSVGTPFDIIIRISTSPIVNGDVETM